METQIEIQTTETRRVQLPYFAKRGNTYYWAVGKRKHTGAIYGHAVYSDGAVMLNTAAVDDAFHKEAVEVAAEEFWNRWREAVAALQAMEGGKP